jgi:transcriptional activator of cad operon
MRLLLCLAERAGEVVSMEEMLKQVWPGVIVTQDSVYRLPSDRLASPSAWR